MKMLKTGTKLLIAVLLSVGLVGCGDNNKHTIKGQVVDVGACKGGTGGFFSESHQCAISVRRNGKIEYWKVYGPVIKGQTVYKHCWTESKGDYCYQSAETSIRKGYSN